MIPGRIPGATRYLGAPVGWEPEKDGHCAHLAVRDMPVNGGPGNPGVPAMHSVWEPTPDELERLKAGAPVYLIVIGSAHPPVSLSVGRAPAEVERPDDPVPGPAWPRKPPPPRVA